MSYSRLKVVEDSWIIRVVLNRPETRNAFDAEMIREITKLFKSFGKRKKEKAIFLSGEGPSFCAGADLEWMKKSVHLSKAQNLKDAENLFDMFAAVRDCPIPVVTKVHGHCMGGGVGLVASSDIVLAEQDTNFCFSEVRLGLVPAVISSFVLARGVPSRLRGLMLTAELFSAEVARESGLVNEVGRELELDKKLKDLAERFGEAGPVALRATKQLLADLPNAPKAKVKSLSVQVIAKQRTSPEGQEGLKAFVEKRKPKWIL